MKIDTPLTTYLSEYAPPPFQITHSELEFDLDAENTRIAVIHHVQRRDSGCRSLILDFESVAVDSIYLNNQALEPEQFSLDEPHLELGVDLDTFQLTINCHIDPSANTALSGLYQSGDMLCTQCEAEGFRRILPSIDRPDNLGTYRVKLIGDPKAYPVMLCNGNLVESGSDGDKHFTVWEDPFPKPTYLFAIVAGNLDCMEDTFKTVDNRDVTLRFYARGRDIGKCTHAMESLKRSMLWDEQVYGRIYDLDLFNVVAVEDFNMGAMENKSLNIFNTKYVLAAADMASDQDFQNVEGVIGHEYFHNWSGNRVTCRDWFQLSLKEGFTVFRDQEFSADMNSRAVKRIEDVNLLRTHQFPEDAGAMAHPVRPESYQEINNFYTATVYNKGAEVVRMMHTLLGPEKFRQGTDLYFERFDGMAVTTDDFVNAMEEVSGRELSQFRNWYGQAGTPRLKVRRQFNAAAGSMTLEFEQSCPPTPGQEKKKPFVVPVKLAIFSPSGEKLPLTDGMTDIVLEISRPNQSATFEGIPELSVPSILRGFSAPVELETDLDDQDLELLLNNDDDPFNRWESAQRLYMRELLAGTADAIAGRSPRFSQGISDSFGHVIEESMQDRAFQAQLLQLPNSGYVGEQLDEIDPVAVYKSHFSLRHHLASRHKTSLESLYNQCSNDSNGNPTSREMASRSLRDMCLAYLCTFDDEQAWTLAENQLTQSRCMTDSASAIVQLARLNHPDKSTLLEQFYDQWKHEPLVMDKWLRAQAIVPRPDTINRVRELTEHPAFDASNPNKVYALVLGFTHGNAVGFHNTDGSGYSFLEDWVKRLDPINPQVSARLVSALNSWRKYTPELRNLMQETLASILASPALSSDVREIVSKNLDSATS